MRFIVGVSSALIVAGANTCDPPFDCQWYYTDSHSTLYEYDFSGLCASMADYRLIDSVSNESYDFNICGYTHAHCNPRDWDVRYRVGRAIQFWGDAPSCNVSAPECTNMQTGVAECCTKPCEVLGTGPPLWSVVNPANPSTGGVSLTYWGVPSLPDDGFKCPPDNITGATVPRSITIVLQCDATLQANEFEPVSIAEVSTCQYQIVGATGASCACAPNCTGKLCGSDGCGGSCSGAGFALPSGCPTDYVSNRYVPQVCIDGNCCRPDCGARDCGTDGCGGTCGTCGGDEVCAPQQFCESITQYAPQYSPVYTTDAGGLTGAYFGGIFSALAVAGAVYFFFHGGKAAFDKWRFSEGSTTGLLSGKQIPADGSAPAKGGLATGAAGGSYGSSSGYSTIGASTSL